MAINCADPLGASSAGGLAMTDNDPKHTCGRPASDPLDDNECACDLFQKLRPPKEPLLDLTKFKKPQLAPPSGLTAEQRTLLARSVEGDVWPQYAAIRCPEEYKAAVRAALAEIDALKLRNDSLETANSELEEFYEAELKRSDALKAERDDWVARYAEQNEQLDINAHESGMSALRTEIGALKAKNESHKETIRRAVASSGALAKSNADLRALVAEMDLEIQRAIGLIEPTDRCGATSGCSVQEGLHALRAALAKGCDVRHEPQPAPREGLTFSLTRNQARHVLDVLVDANLDRCPECSPIEEALKQWLNKS